MFRTDDAFLPGFFSLGDPFEDDCERFVYASNPQTGEHAYVNLGTGSKVTATEALYRGFACPTLPPVEFCGPCPKAPPGMVRR